MDTNLPNDADEALKKAVAFHGHICPGLVYGYRAARAALRELGPRAEDEEIVAIVENNSCAVDAVQVLTGCTFGKGNLIFRDYGKQVYTFLSRNTGRGVRISVDFQSVESPADTQMWKRQQAGDRSAEVEAAVARIRREKIRKILEEPDDHLLTIRPAVESMPEKARIYASLRCARCGEKMMEPRARLLNGSTVCLPCFEQE